MCEDFKAGNFLKKVKFIMFFIFKDYIDLLCRIDFSENELKTTINFKGKYDKYI